MIIVENISKTYKSKKGTKTKALDKVSFTLPKKGLIFILGKSGSGKSTLLNILGGLDKYDEGNIIIDGKSTKKFKNKDFDYYRNTYIGFIFQEFNLLDEYNVYDNIMLSTKLQKQKLSIDRLDKILEQVDMKGLGNRKINELSGGQKQRVAIVRAIIKNPEMILADEPTGSLDQETGKQIFGLLKEISKEKLVIIVSHDRESATKYADGIIEIQDGHIVSNNLPIINSDKDIFKAKKSSLPFLDSLKFAILNLGVGKIKLIFTIILIAMSLIFYGTSKVLSEFNIEKSYAKTMVNTNEEYITIKKSSYNSENKSWDSSFSSTILNSILEEDINTIDKKLNNNTYKSYQLIENNELVHFDTNYREVLSNSDRIVYYMLIPNYLSFIEGDASFIKNKVIGHYPANYDEVMIHSYFADCLMKFGIALYNDTNSTTFKQEYYHPTSYEELINEGKYLKLGSTKVKISGIIIDDVEEYESLKTTKSTEIQNNANNDTLFSLGNRNTLYYKFSSKIARNATDIYVMKDFSKNINLNKNIVISNSYYSVNATINDKNYYPSGNYSYLDKKINIYNGNKYQTIDKLNDNELIVTETFLNSISGNDNYNKLKDNYLKDYQAKAKAINIENKEIEERNNQKLEAYSKALENNEEVEEPNLEELKDFDYKSDDELLEEFISNYLKENNIMSLNASLSIKNNEDNNIKPSNYDNLKIIGLNLDNDTIYMGNNIAKEAMLNNSYLEALRLRSNNKKELENIFKKFKIKDTKYYSETTYSSAINAISDALTSVSYLAFYASVIFGIFALILLTNFIVNSIAANKKNIGILRALGARRIDTFKIFLNEGLIIGIISLIISIIVIYIEVYYLNKYISSHLFFNIELVMFTKENLLIIVLSVLSIIFLSSLLTVDRIVKMKPVDAIINK